MRLSDLIEGRVLLGMNGCVQIGNIFSDFVETGNHLIEFCSDESRCRLLCDHRSDSLIKSGIKVIKFCRNFGTFCLKETDLFRSGDVARFESFPRLLKRTCS